MTTLDAQHLNELVNILDQALLSGNPTVMQALQNLILVSSLAADAAQKGVGPMTQLFNEHKALGEWIKKLEVHINQLEYKINDLKHRASYSNHKIDTYSSGADELDWHKAYTTHKEQLNIRLKGLSSD